MKVSLFFAGTLACVLSDGDAMDQTKADRCAAYARDAMASTPTSTGVVRGAARGAVGGAIFGNAGAESPALIDLATLSVICV